LFFLPVTCQSGRCRSRLIRDGLLKPNVPAAYGSACRTHSGMEAESVIGALMPPRSSWKGFLKLSLVSVPVKAFTATASAGGEIHLNQLHAECHSRIQYKKTCPIHGEVSNDQIVSGYEYAKGQYVVVDTEELSKLRTEDDKAINIDVFISANTL